MKEPERNKISMFAVSFAFLCLSLSTGSSSRMISVVVVMANVFFVVHNCWYFYAMVDAFCMHTKVRHSIVG